MTHDDTPVQTTDAGIPVESDAYSLNAGADGPVLLQDGYLTEQMARWNRERIPERQPHAKGSGALGRLEVTADVSDYTKAALFQPGTVTRLAARFSTVAGERGSPDLQAGTLVGTVTDDAARDRLVASTVAQSRNGVTGPVQQRAFGYLRNVDENLGDRVEKGIRDAQR
jgi:catalase